MNRKAILQYLNCPSDVDERTNLLIDECIEEVKLKSNFKTVSKRMSLTFNPLKIEDIDMELQSEDLNLYFEGCHEVIITSCTLGPMIDRTVKFYEKIDMAKAVVFDAVSSRYLEECQDAYEKEHIEENHTFRFAPGYGDLPLDYNIPLSRVLNIEKNLGVSINKGGLFVPMKSMLGIIGIGAERKKTCGTCIKKGQCSLRKVGLRCYVND